MIRWAATGWRFGAVGVGRYLAPARGREHGFARGRLPPRVRIRSVPLSLLTLQVSMADAAFALSPISAQPASPTDADFQAISEAFMETTRGRWFLAEFARRNRNADTAMVLDAVARIESTLAAQKEQQAQQAPPPPPEPSTELPEALAAVKTILAAARDSADAVLSDSSEVSLALGVEVQNTVKAIYGEGFDARVSAPL